MGPPIWVSINRRLSGRFTDYGGARPVAQSNFMVIGSTDHGHRYAAHLPGFSRRNRVVAAAMARRPVDDPHAVTVPASLDICLLAAGNRKAELIGWPWFGWP